MCCLFTCVGWFVDVIQRLWVFAMSCIIFSAICCALITCSMSGVALGYNYSLAEYMDLKETNVSIYFKRGIFDDEISDDMDENQVRRRMDGESPGVEKEGTKEETETTMKSRRLEDSIIQSEDNNNYEGQLIRLTGKTPIYTISTTPSPTFELDTRWVETTPQFSEGSVDHLKAAQAAINRRKEFAARDPNVKRLTTVTRRQEAEPYPSVSQNPVILRRLNDEDPKFYPPHPSTFAPERVLKLKMDRNMRRMDSRHPEILDLEYVRTSTVNSARQAVPPQDIGSFSNWVDRKNMRRDDYYFDTGDETPPYPKPVTIERNIVRPTATVIATPIRPTLTTEKVTEIVEVEKNKTKPVQSELDKFKEDMMLDKLDEPRLKAQEEGKIGEEDWKKKELDYYDDDLKGLPVKRRRKRNIDPGNVEIETNSKSNPSEEPVKFKVGENGNIFNEFTNRPNIFVSKLLLLNKPLATDTSFSNEKESSSLSEGSNKLNHESSLFWSKFMFL